ncbi:hypothetical protein ACFO72_004347 [Enterobacter roggenkampii]
MHSISVLSVVRNRVLIDLNPDGNTGVMAGLQPAGNLQGIAFQAG